MHSTFQAAKVIIMKSVILSLVALLVFISCTNPAGSTSAGSPEDPPAGNDAPFVQDGISLVLSPYKLKIQVRVETTDWSPVSVEGCGTTTSIPANGATKTLTASSGRTIKLRGNISHFHCAGSFTGGNQQITAINVQGCSNLQYLNCGYNKFTELNVNNLSNLISLICDNNSLDSLDVQSLHNLKLLHCDHNTINSLNVQSLSNLVDLNCSFNQLSALNVQNLLNLKTLHCNHNQLSSLDVQGLSNLGQLSVSYNQLSGFNGSNLPVLNTLLCNNNQLTTLNLQNCTDLKNLYCHQNNLDQTAFSQIFEALPSRTSGDVAKCFLYINKSYEGNYKFTTTNAPSGFTNARDNKNWAMLYIPENGGYNEWTNIP